MDSPKLSIIGNGPSAIGTQVLLDGVPLPRVTRVELVADCKDRIWRAVIYAVPDVIDVSGLEASEASFVNVL